MSREILEDIIKDFNPEKFVRFFRAKNSSTFLPIKENLDHYKDANFKDGIKLGEIKFSEDDKLIICAFKAGKSLSERSGKKAQYELGRKVLKENQIDAGIFIFYDEEKKFRFSLIYTNYLESKKKDWSAFRRYTYFVGEGTNKTFLKQIGEKDFSTLNNVKNAFSISAVTDIFYNDFFAEYDKILKSVVIVNKIDNTERAESFVLLFAIRTIFLGFIQKKRWIGDIENFIQDFFTEYKNKYFKEDKFYKRWLCPLFFEALNSPPGRKVAYNNNEFSKETEQQLQMSPYLNGGLFKKKNDFDDQGWIIPDKEIDSFFNFLFSYSFTIEENSPEDEDLQLNPEFLGIIFERLVNKKDGAVYTPRTEVDLMCRLSLVKWLQKNLKVQVKIDDIYKLLFKESDKEQQTIGDLSKEDAEYVLKLLENVIVCDPAVGSGAFLVGMMQVLDEVGYNLNEKIGAKNNNVFDRKKQIIGRSLYGVEVKEWAVWICQLRLWLSLFVEAPDDFKNSMEAILPSLDFKVRKGDSLVQRVGSKLFPITGHIQIQNNSIKAKITQLKSLKTEYYNNKATVSDWELRQKEKQIYDDIINIEIDEKQNQLNSFKNYKSKKTASMFSDMTEPDQTELELDKDKIEKIKLELEDLKEQKAILSKGEKPLVWSIEFAEVFAEKGGFDIIIGNPPYVRQESISDPTEKIKDKKIYKNLLSEMVKMDFPDDFLAKTKINAQSDLYTYFYIRGLRLLNPLGVHTFICSNSWLDVGYGAWLQEFLLKRCPVDLIIDNHAKRSFEVADVNTIISIVHAPQKKVDENHLVKFVAYKRPFEEIMFTEDLLIVENTKKVLANDGFRVYPISVKDLIDFGTEYENENQEKLKSGKYIGDKWGGKYLRAPDIFFTILEKGKDKLVKLGDIAKVSFGIKTGVNEFFYLDDEAIKKWGIEKDFLKPVIKSPRECRSILVDPKDLKYKIFICNKSKEELNGTNALKYIEWGEKQKTKEGVYWKNVPSVSSRKFWWEASIQEFAFCSYPMINNIRLIFFKNNFILNDANLVGIYPKKDFGNSLLVSLNSTYNMINMELMGIANLGEGAIKQNPIYIKKSIIIDPEIIPNYKVEPFFNREIYSIFEECGIDPKSETPIEEQEPKPLPDRAELDNIVFDALGLNNDERKEVYRSVCRLVWNRISKAKSV